MQVSSRMSIRIARRWHVRDASSVGVLAVQVNLSVITRNKSRSEENGAAGIGRLGSTGWVEPLAKPITPQTTIDGYRFAPSYGVLLRLKRKRNLAIGPATKQHDGKITKSLSIPSHKNIPLNLSGKSALGVRPSHPMRGADRESSRTCGEMRWTRELRLTIAT
jgi:hypothetical protein